MYTAKSELGLKIRQLSHTPVQWVVLMHLQPTNLEEEEDDETAEEDYPKTEKPRIQS